MRYVKQKILLKVRIGSANLPVHIRRDDAPWYCKCWKHITPLVCGVTCSTKLLKLCGTWTWFTPVIRTGYLTFIFDWKMWKYRNSCAAGHTHPFLALAANKPTLHTLENQNQSAKYFHSNWEKSQGYSPKSQPTGLALHPGIATTVRITILYREFTVHHTDHPGDQRWEGVGFRARSGEIYFPSL